MTKKAYPEFRPKRREVAESKESRWMKQNEYDSISWHLNRLTNEQLLSYTKVEADTVHTIPLLVRGRQIRWIAKGILAFRKQWEAGKRTFPGHIIPGSKEARDMMALVKLTIEKSRNGRKR